MNTVHRLCIWRALIRFQRFVERAERGRRRISPLGLRMLLMRSPSYPGAIGALLWLWLAASPPTAEAACKGPESADTFPKASAAIGAWERAHDIRMLQNTRSTVLREYCEAAEQFAAETQTKTLDIDERSPQVIAEYLDRLIDDRGAQASVSALLRSAFGASGFSRPKPKRWGLLRITYTRKVDTLLLGQERIDPVATALVGIGKLIAIGLQRQNEVCSAELQIVAGENQFDCK
jgi:hypothetical protein